MSLRLALKRSQEEASLKQSQADVKGQERKSKKASKKPKKTAEGTVEERKGKAQSPAKSRKQKQKKANGKKTTKNRKQGRKGESERDAEDVVVEEEEEEDDDEFEARNRNYVNRIAKFLYDDGKWYKLRILKFKKSKRTHECIYLRDKSRQDLFIDTAIELGKLQFLDGGEQKSNLKEKKVSVKKKIDQTVQSKETRDVARNKKRKRPQSGGEKSPIKQQSAKKRAAVSKGAKRLSKIVKEKIKASSSTKVAGRGKRARNEKTPSAKESTENSITSSSSKDSRAVEARTAYEGKYKPPKAIKHIKRLDAPPASAGGSVRKNSVALAQHQRKSNACNDSISWQRQQVQSGSMVDNGEKKLRSKASIFSAEKIAKEDAKKPIDANQMLHAVLMDRAMRLLKLPVTSRLTCISLYHRIYHYKDVVRRYLGGNGTQDIYYDNMKLAIACVFLGSKSTDNQRSLRDTLTTFHRVQVQHDANDSNRWSKKPTIRDHLRHQPSTDFLPLDQAYYGRKSEVIRYEQYVLNGLGYHVDALDTIKIYSCVVDLLKIPADDVAWRAQALDILFDMHFSQWICLHTESVERVVAALFLSAYTLTSTWRSQSVNLSPHEISTLEKLNDTRNNILNTTLLHLTSVEGVKESRLQMIIKHFMKSQKIINGDKHIASTPAHMMYNADSKTHAPNAGKDQTKSNSGRVDTRQRAQPNGYNGNGYRNGGAAEANEASRASTHSDGWGGKHRYGQGSEWHGAKMSLSSTRSDGPNRRQPNSHGWNDNVRQANRRDSNNRSWDWDHGSASKFDESRNTYDNSYPNSEKQKPCFNYRDHGYCNRGSNCLYFHDEDLTRGKNTRSSRTYGARHASTDVWHSRKNDEGQHARRSYGRNNDRLHSGRTDTGATSHVGGASSWHSNRGTLTNFNDIRRGDKFMGRIVNEINIGVFVDFGMMYNGNNKHGLLRRNNMTQATREYIKMGAVIQVKVLEKFESEGIGKCELMEV